MRTTLTVLAAMAVTAGGAAPALAYPTFDYEDEEDEDLDERRPTRRIHTEIGVGFMGGGFGLGGVHDSTDGVVLHGGYRRGRLLLQGELDGLTTGGDDLVEGMLLRAGANARLDLGVYGGTFNEGWAGGILWGELGVGWEQFRFDNGRRVDRPDLAIGLGAQYTIRFGRIRPRLVGIYMAGKVLVADAPELADMQALCAAGCGAKAGSSRDIGIFFSMALTFGK